MSEEIVTVIVVRRDGSSFVDSSVLVNDNMFEGVTAWLDSDPDYFRIYQEKKTLEILNQRYEANVEVSK